MINTKQTQQNSANSDNQSKQADEVDFGCDLCEFYRVWHLRAHQPPARWSIKLLYIQPFSGTFLPVFGHLAHMYVLLLLFTQARKRIYKQTEGFMKDVLAHATEEKVKRRASVIGWAAPAAQRLKEEDQTARRHVKRAKRIVFIQRCVRFLPLNASGSPSLGCTELQKVSAADMNLIPPIIILIKNTLFSCKRTEWHIYWTQATGRVEGKGNTQVQAPFVFCCMCGKCGEGARLFRRGTSPPPKKQMQIVPPMFDQ